MKTTSIKSNEVKRDWYIVDATDVILGRMSTKVATILKGKHKPTFTPHVDCGDYVVVINADKVRLTGNKENTKLYWRYTQYPGGERSTPIKKQRQEHPDRIITHAVKGMLPKGPLGRQMIKKLRVYGGEAHPHAAQQPQTLTIS